MLDAEAGPTSTQKALLPRFEGREVVGLLLGWYQFLPGLPSSVAAQTYTTRSRRVALRRRGLLAPALDEEPLAPSQVR